MELTKYRQEFIRNVQEKAAMDSTLDQDAFFHVACEMLRDSEAIVDYTPIEPGYRYGEGTSRFMAIDGYDQSAFEMDESIVVIACDDDFSMRINETASTIQAKECMRYINAMRRYIISAWEGAFLEQAEESGAAYGFASYIKEHRADISRFRLYFITDRIYTGRDSSIKDPTDFYSTDDDGHRVSLEAHVWDLRHFMESAEAAAPLEHLTVSLGLKGIAAVKAPDSQNSMDTYLLFLSAQMLAGWYKKHGSKLMEANVRSFLSLRGKVNRGIRNTLGSEPERFVAYNNGLSATASEVDVNENGCITSIQDLQLVNGGQTTASIFYSQLKDNIDLSKVVVPVKLVVVGEDVARELVPFISRYTNSQNKVAETDFSSNSEYQVKLSQLSQQILTPPLPESPQTHWYYERTRGQYDSEKNRRDTADRRRFEKLNPNKQRIKMIDAPKYLMCWDCKPEIASLGSQKCFAKFVSLESQKGKNSVESLDTDFYKQLVCKRIIFDTVYKSIRTAAWYKGAYQANIAEYAVSKFSFDLQRAALSFDFASVWRAQAIDAMTLDCLLKAAGQASEVLNDQGRPTQNVSEWAKKDACWYALQLKPNCLHIGKLSSSCEEFSHGELPTLDTQNRGADLADSSLFETDPELTNGNIVSDWSLVSPHACRSLYIFANEHHILSPKVSVSLAQLISGIPGELDINALNQLADAAAQNGFPIATFESH